MAEETELNQDSLTPEEGDVTPEIDENVEPGELSTEQVAKVLETNRKLFARAKKAEAEAKALKEKPAPKEVVEPQPKDVKPTAGGDVESIINQKLEERDFDSLELTDTGRQDIKSYAKAARLTAKQVTNSDYFKFVKDKEDAARKVEEASIGGKRGALTHKDLSKVSLDDFDLNTEEGRKEYEEYKKLRK